MRDAAKFFDQMSFYEQVLDGNYMFHDEIYRAVARLLADHYADRRFSVLDLGCGSARHLSRALAGRPISAYKGYDLAEPPLAVARQNLAAIGCPIELRRGDLVEALRNETAGFDLIFCGFSLHHLTAEEKAEFFQMAHRRLNIGGLLLIVDPAREEDEPRPIYLDHYCGWIRSEWKAMSPAAVDAICDHIWNNDYPETSRDLRAIAGESGFDRARELERFRWHHTWAFEKVFPSRVAIDTAMAADAAAIARVHTASWRTTYAGIIPDDYIAKFTNDARDRTWRAILGDAARRDLVCVAKDEEGTVVGFVSGGPARGSKDFIGELYAIYLLDDYQRRGIGRRLAGALARRLLRAGHSSMVAWVLKNNSACHFYAALGGVVVGEKPAEISGTDLTEVAYGWTDIRRLLD
ncbi:MAG TPA: GNAT family N-acetyltransferase [Candidatus Binatia bacterium]|jgi:SAM-dependent methyltransferase